MCLGSELDLQCWMWVAFVLRSVCGREAAPAFNFRWHLVCYGWRVEFKSFIQLFDNPAFVKIERLRL